MRHILFTLLLIQYINVIAQSNKGQQKDITKTEIFEINPFGDDISKAFLKYGSKVKFKITNVNQFKIQAANNAIKQSMSFDAPAPFSQPLMQPGNESNNLEGAAKEQQDLKVTLQSLEKEKNSKALTLMNSSNEKDFISRNKSSQLKRDTAELNKRITELRNQISILEKIIKEKESIDSLKNQFITNYNCFILSLNQLAVYTSVDAYIDSMLQETFIPDIEILKSNLTSYMQSINDNDNNINLIRNKCQVVLGNFTNCYINAKSAYDELAKKIKNEKVKVTGQLTTTNKEVTLKVDSAFFTFEREKYFEKEFQFLTGKYDAIHPEKKRTEIKNKTNDGVNYYYRVKNANFDVYTDAQQLDDDIIEITPKLKNAKGEIVKEFSPIKIKTYGGIKVDFSSGYLLSFKGDENYTNLYDSTGIIGVQKNNSDDLRHAIGAMMSVYPRWRSSVTLGFSAGISIPTDGTRIGFYGGLSVLMLEKNRLVISAGVAYNKTKLLNTANLLKDDNATKTTEKETYKFSNTDFKEIRYDDLYRPAFFVGLTYNLFTIKK